MDYSCLPQTDIKVSVYALGCWPFAGGKVWGYQDDAESVRTVHAALDAGINFFDTAEGYEDGHSERVLGRGLVGRREDAVIATKVSPNHLAPDAVRQACEASLRNLQTDYIDLYQIHWPDWQTPLVETVEALAKLKAEGKVRAIGVCNFGVRDLTDMLALGECVSDQLPYSLLWRVIEREVRPLCVTEEVGIICYSPLAQGVLTGRYTGPDEVPDGLARTRLYAGDRPMATHGEPGCEVEMFAAVAEVARIAADLGEPMAAVALAWVRQQMGVTSLLVGARTPDEVALNLPALELHLPEAVLEELSAVTEPVAEKLGANLDMWVTPSRIR